MKWNVGTELKISRATHGIVVGLALVGLIVFFRELPAMRRYFRMERM